MMPWTIKNNDLGDISRQTLKENIYFTITPWLSKESTMEKVFSLIKIIEATINLEGEGTLK